MALKAISSGPYKSLKGLISPLRALEPGRYAGLIRPSKGLIRPFKGLIRPFKDLIRPLKGLTGAFQTCMDL